MASTTRSSFFPRKIWWRCGTVFHTMSANKSSQETIECLFFVEMNEIVWIELNIYIKVESLTKLRNMEGNLSTISAKKPVNIVNPQGRGFQLSAAQLNTKSIANSYPLISQASFIILLLNLHLFLVLLPLVMCDLHISLPENQGHNHIQQLCLNPDHPFPKGRPLSGRCEHPTTLHGSMDPQGSSKNKGDF